MRDVRDLGSKPTSAGRRSLSLPVVVLAAAVGPCAASGGEGPATDPRIANGWRVLRAVDCARCHGRDYTGLAAPSLIAYVAAADRSSFSRTVQDGDPPRGMPGYRGNRYVVDNLDDIYRYLSARAAGDIGRDYRPSPITARQP